MSSIPNPGRTRSPSYPSIGLADAIGRLKLIYDRQQRHPATREIIARLLGYGGLNGASASVVSALSKYGLLEGHGDNLRVSPLGQDLVLHRKGDPEYEEALRTAAFMPAFFRELRDQYPQGLPSEHSLRASLIKRGFNPKAIDGAVRAYRESVEFLEAETLSHPETLARPEERPATGDTNTPTPGYLDAADARSSHSNLALADGRLRTVVLPLSASEWATLQAAFPLSESAWKQMMVVLEAMKPALVDRSSSRVASTQDESIEPETD